MGCNKHALRRVMASVRNRHPNYGLKRRKKIARAIIYSRRK